MENLIYVEYNGDDPRLTKGVSYKIREQQLDVVEEDTLISVDDIVGWFPLRDFKPSMIYVTMDEDGNLHSKNDEPSYVCLMTHTAWHKHGERHREHGPALVLKNGGLRWYLDGKKISTWKEYHELSTLSPQEQMVVKLKYGEQLS